MKGARENLTTQAHSLEHADLHAELEGAWRSANEEANAAYRHWCVARSTGRLEAYRVYVAAADREAAAVEHLRASLVGR
jgi:hypothetical protein